MYSSMRELPQRFFPICLFVLLCLPLSMLAQEEEDSEKQSFFSRLYQEEIKAIDVELQLDLKVFLKNKKKEEYQEGKIRFVNPYTQEEEEWDVELRPRGNMRRKISYIPPIKLKLSKKNLKSKGLEKFNKIKMVSQFRNGIMAEQYVLKEFHAYKMYNMISPYSFRVQLIRLTLRDQSAKKRVVKYYGFLIEPMAELADRFNGVEIEREKVRSGFLVEKEFQKMSLFQYMIGNTDWSVGNSHNLKLLKVPDLSKMVPIPYDFDYAGLVNAVYAAPYHTLPIDKVTERLYRGNSFSSEDMEEIIPQFEAKAGDMIQLLESCDYLDKRSKKHTVTYMRSFFKECKRRKSFAYVLQKYGY
ncbi:MAG: hypothetical protein HRU41_37350 [Saprospiraceae bacterium]|nr:hypothetical protein [Saprospiraceae bacterium]